MDIIDNKKNDSVLLMLSGGRDSFLSACYLIEAGRHVFMITYHNGCMSNATAVESTAERIIKIYGEDCATYLGVHSIADSLYYFQEPFLYQTIQQSAIQYPNLRPAQLPCLACHTGMYVASIAYCKTHNISCLAEGARKTQKFFVELPEMVQRYQQLTEENGIELLLPVYDMDDDWKRKMELTSRDFTPKTLEPQCWLGCPLRAELNADEINSLERYYDIEMMPKLKNMIDAKTKALRNRKESKWSCGCEL